MRCGLLTDYDGEPHRAVTTGTATARPKKQHITAPDKRSKQTLQPADKCCTYKKALHVITRGGATLNHAARTNFSITPSVCAVGWVTDR